MLKCLGLLFDDVHLLCDYSLAYENGGVSILFKCSSSFRTKYAVIAEECRMWDVFKISLSLFATLVEDDNHCSNMAYLDVFDLSRSLEWSNRLLIILFH